MIFHFTNDFDLCDCSRDRLELTSGDSMGMTARVHGGRVMGSACFALYERGKYGSTALANITDWSRVEGKGYVDYFGVLKLNTEALTALMGAKDTVEVAGEWEIRYADDDGNIITRTSGELEIVVHNDYIKQFPPSPVDTEDAWAKESFVENVLKNRVAIETEAALGGIRDDAEAAAIKAEEARDATKLSESAAGISSESARLHDLSAQDSANRASGSASSAKRSELACEDYARLSRGSAASATQEATNAATSAAEALASKNAAQSIADSLGSEVDGARQAAVDAAASAVSAGQSATEAKDAVNSIGDSVTAAQTAATQAKASATTAGTKATQAATSATNAAASETKAKTSETAAGTSATNAANAATTAAGHASTASTKATQAGTSATAASASATQAANSATTASGHASTASTKATQAAGLATSAANSATQAGTARDAAVTAKTAAEAAADRAEAAEGGITQGELDAALANKLDQPEGGTVGQILTKTTSGTAWATVNFGWDGGTVNNAATFNAGITLSNKENASELIFDDGATQCLIYLDDDGLNFVCGDGSRFIFTGGTLNSTNIYAGDLTCDAFRINSAISSTVGHVLTVTDTNGNMTPMPPASESEFDDHFTTLNSIGGDVYIKPKINGGTFTILYETGNIHILTNKRIYLCSYGSSLDMCGESVMLGTNDYAVLQATSGGSVTISARTSLNFVDASGSFALGDLAKIGDIYYVESGNASGLGLWNAKILPHGWYNVDLLLYSATDITIGMLMRLTTMQAGRIKSAHGMSYAASSVNSGVPYCYYYSDNPWSGGVGMNRTCRIVQLNFLYEHAGNEIDWMNMTDLTKFGGGTVRYAPIQTPQAI